nr:type VI secretion system protein TssL, long form [uncultured Rhodopila sp.]
MSDNPFGNETYVRRPSPGGQTWTSNTPPPMRSRSDPGGGRDAASGQVDIPAAGSSPLLAAAAPLLELLARLGAVRAPPDTDTLRESVVAALRRFRDSARREGFDENTLHTADYILCAALDDVIMNAGWDRTNHWKDNPLVAEFHRNVRAGEGFFEQLERLQRNPSQNVPLLELMYYCLSLGFMGQYRPGLSPGGSARHETIRVDVFEVLRRFTPQAETELSPHWRGGDAPYRPARAVLPLWAIASGVVLCLVGLFLFLSGLLNRSGDEVLTTADATRIPIQSIPRPAAPRPLVPPPPPPDSRTLAELHRFLEPEIKAGLVTVAESPATTLVRIGASGMFASGSAVMDASFLPLLHRIGDALNAEPGTVRVVGHTDNQPIRTVRFQSNRDLSAARAAAARAAIVSDMHDPNRVTAEGHADLEPIAPNDTAAGRDSNRRIEVIVQRQD